MSENKNSEARPVHISRKKGHFLNLGQRNPAGYHGSIFRKLNKNVKLKNRRATSQLEDCPTLLQYHMWTPKLSGISVAVKE